MSNKVLGVAIVGVALYLGAIEIKSRVSGMGSAIAPPVVTEAAKTEYTPVPSTDPKKAPRWNFTRAKIVAIAIDTCSTNLSSVSLTQDCIQEYLQEYAETGYQPGYREYYKEKYGVYP